MHKHPCMRRQLVLFAALTAADLFLTWRLFSVGLSSVSERNPLAAWWLGEFGWPGLAAFKFSTALLTGTSALAISSRRPRAGCGVLAFGCAVLSGVVLYSSVLLGVARELGDDVRASETAAAEKRRVEQEFATALAYKEFQARLIAELFAGRCTLPEAIEQLLATERAHDRPWLNFLRYLYALDSDRDCVATQFMLQVVGTLEKNPERRSPAARKLFAAYRQQFRTPARLPWENGVVGVAAQ
jgi:hypothetical protein